ncbi:MAG: hypothetical protein U5L96_13870 [Owenweeksia sp.]|nr:hypothetical protein [Owenweeksia sp.]
MKNLLYLSLAVVFTLSCDSESASSAGPGSTGQGGSLARFAIANNHLYAVNGTRLKVFDITDPQAVKFRSEDDLNVNVETLFPAMRKRSLWAQPPACTSMILASHPPSHSWVCTSIL